MSTIEPIDTKLLNPTFWFTDQSRIAVHNAPLCDIKAILPGRAILLEKLTFNLRDGLIKPRQFGPIILMLYFLKLPEICSVSFSPSSPISVKPAEISKIP